MGRGRPPGDSVNARKNHQKRASREYRHAQQASEAIAAAEAEAAAAVDDFFIEYEDSKEPLLNCKCILFFLARLHNRSKARMVVDVFSWHYISTRVCS